MGNIYRVLKGILMIKKLKEGSVASSISITDWNEIADFINLVSCTKGLNIGRNNKGGLEITLSDDIFQFREITMAEKTLTESGVDCIVFRKVSVFCGLPGPVFDATEVGSSAEYDENGDLIAIHLGAFTVEVEPAEEPPAV